MRRHAFTATIEDILTKRFGKAGIKILEASPLLGYLNLKTKSASEGSKARGSFANHYALYVLIEDYIKKGYGPMGPNRGKYKDYAGARFSDLFTRQRELPFGKKLQNHALNARLNDEFKKYYPSLDREPVLRDVASQRYWIHEDLLNVEVSGENGRNVRYNLAEAVLEIINAYVATKMQAFESFIQTCKEIEALSGSDANAVVDFVTRQLQPDVDARVFEVVSFAVLKTFYGEHSVFWGWTRDAIQEAALVLYKTGRTNANDGGIDFVMRPLGRFFQVTETVDVHKYFLDIDKIQRFPLTFVVKSVDTTDNILASIRRQADEKYGVKAVVDSYMSAVEEIINVPILLDRLSSVVEAQKVGELMREIVAQSKVEFNYEEPAEEE